MDNHDLLKHFLPEGILDYFFSHQKEVQGFLQQKRSCALKTKNYSLTPWFYNKLPFFTLAAHSVRH